MTVALATLRKIAADRPPKDTGGCAGDDQSSTGQQEKAFGPDGERQPTPALLME